MNDEWPQAEPIDPDYLTELSALYEISSIPTSLISPEELGRLVVEKATRLIGAPIGLLYRWDRPETYPQLWAIRGMPVAEVGSLSTESGPIVRALTEGQLVNLEGTDAVQALGVLPAYYAACRGLCLPIRAGTSIRALLCLFRLADKLFTRTDLSLLNVLADRAGTALETIRLFVETERRQQALEQEIVERRQVEAALASSNGELEQFAYVVSHDLQEPLRMVKSYLQLLGRRYQGQLDRDADEFIAFAVDGASRMQTLISNLLTYSRVTADARPFEPINCTTVLKSVLADLQLAIEGSGVVVTYDDLPTVGADAIQLRRLFQNLVGNAIKFRGDRVPEIHVGVEREAAGWVFWVGDNGIGIKADQFDRIFMIFQQLHSPAEYEGTGIGLAICKKIVERHGGRIWVESQPGQGSTFYFTLPDNLVAK